MNTIVKDGQHCWQSMLTEFYAHAEYAEKNCTRTLCVCQKIDVNTECAQTKFEHTECAQKKLCTLRVR